MVAPTCKPIPGETKAGNLVFQAALRDITTPRLAWATQGDTV